MLHQGITEEKIRAEYNQRLWELNNSFFDPANLSAQGFSRAVTFSNNRRSSVPRHNEIGDHLAHKICRDLDIAEPK